MPKHARQAVHGQNVCCHRPCKGPQEESRLARCTPSQARQQPRTRDALHAGQVGMQSSRHGPLTRSSARAGDRLTYAGPWHAKILCTQQPALLGLDRMCMAYGTYRQQPLSRRRSPPPPSTSQKSTLRRTAGTVRWRGGGRAAALMPRGTCWVPAPSLILHFVRASRTRPAR